GVQPAVDDGLRRLIRHLSVAGRHHRVAQQELSGATDLDVATGVVDDADLVDRAESRVLAGGAERAERPGAPRPDQAVRRLRHRVSTHDLEPEALLERLLPLTFRRRARVTEPKVGGG